MAADYKRRHDLIDMTGLVCGRLTVLRLAPKTGRRGAAWHCRCSCGNEIVARGETLRKLQTISCGCLRPDLYMKHGMYGTRVWSVWANMRQRCEQSNDARYKNYGARGIRVCKRWQQFANFYSDMGDPPAGYSIERIDNDGNYEPGNCKWATKSEQQNNTRATLRLGVERLSAAECSRKLGANRTLVSHRLRYGWSVEEAVTKPPQIKSRRRPLLP